jgi:pimeloyl-ACP methyl ester carboxylesterase
MPGADLSALGMTQLMADFMAARDLHDVILVGNDTGGALAQMVRAQFPERISSLVDCTVDAPRTSAQQFAVCIWRQTLN